MKEIMNTQANDARQMSKRELFEAIGAVSFSLDDLRLYLDTHPDDAKALELYSELQKKRHQLTAEYAERFGSIASYCVNTENGWGSASEPMPWQAEAN